MHETRKKFSSVAKPNAEFKYVVSFAAKKIVSPSEKIILTIEPTVCIKCP